MFKIDHATAASTQPTKDPAGTQGYFTEGNSNTGEVATIVTADFLNMIQNELKNIVDDGDITASKSQDNQVLKALKNIFMAQHVYPTGVDLNDIIIPGNYRVQNGNSNIWPQGDFGNLLVCRGGDTIFQLGIGYGDGNSMYFRNGNPSDIGGAGNWNAWQPILTPRNTGIVFAGNTFKSTGPALAIGDSDTGLVQNGDGKLEFWANNQRIFKYNNAAINFERAMSCNDNLWFNNSTNDTPGIVLQQVNNTQFNLDIKNNVVHFNTSYLGGGGVPALRINTSNQETLIEKLNVTGYIQQAGTDIFSGTNASTGYFKTSSGLIIQWGRRLNATTNTFITFPITFPNAVNVVTSTESNQNPAAAITTSVTNLQTDGFTHHSNLVSTGGTITVSTPSWIAIGY